ncbi:thiol peroxidase [Methylocucumis oryzae]|uniref:Redoxin domain-containing protein n=1 Tax=Methylocucumis oryzae TaxID=1632867 RepID=A0A0F3IL33_9GAMM|nr:thiol peroxidase [Methylocucumis oryzae]KJV07387.1 hypothetical protein VZ94_05070 [Methylocucumis oryzae]
MATVFFHGVATETSGQLPELNSVAPDFQLTNHHMLEVSLAAFSGRKKLLAILPSIDTPICVAVARKFEHKAEFLHSHNTQTLIVSADLPFAQCRFATNEDLTTLTWLSSFRSTFLQDYGIMITDGILRGLPATALVLIDENNRVIYTQLVADLCSEPDYETLFACLSSVDSC